MLPVTGGKKQEHQKKAAFRHLDRMVIILNYPAYAWTFKDK